MQRLRAKKRNQSILVGLTWYNAETWAEVKASASDPECLEDSFPAWEKMAVQARRELQRSGVRAVECHIVPQDFFAWCAAHGKVNNAAARAEFVTETLSAAGAPI
jgi:hypothetical protein